MAQWQFLLGRRELEVTCADRVALINALNNAKIRLQNVIYNNDLTIRVTIAECDLKRMLKIAEKLGASVKERGRSGAYPFAIAILQRPVLLVFLGILLLLVCYIPSRVFFISIEGNTTIPYKLIVETAQECGIDFGASRRQVRSEKMKNALLEKIPQLQWAGINTRGCTAVISVREKTTQDVEKTAENTVCSIVAARDGVIQNCTVFQGNPLCSVGQAVKAGQTLVSGYMDCGIVIKTTCADAEINALTFRELEVISPAPAAERGEMIKQKNCYSLQIGKKLIKLSKDSGNSGTECVKIYMEKYLCLPGGFRLPVTLVKETFCFYEDAAESQTMSDSGDWLSGFSKSYLEGAMIAGKIMTAQEEISSGEDACYLYGKYACMEMIGQVKYEQKLLKDEQND